MKHASWTLPALALALLALPIRLGAGAAPADSSRAADNEALLGELGTVQGLDETQVARIRAKHLGIKPEGKKLAGRGFDKTLTKKFDGSVVRRTA